MKNIDDNFSTDALKELKCWTFGNSCLILIKGNILDKPSRAVTYHGPHHHLSTSHWKTSKFCDFNQPTIRPICSISSTSDINVRLLHATLIQKRCMNTKPTKKNQLSSLKSEFPSRKRGADVINVTKAQLLKQLSTQIFYQSFALNLEVSLNGFLILLIPHCTGSISSHNANLTRTCEQVSWRS